MLLKAALALLIAGVMAFTFYSFTSRPDYEVGFQMEQGTLHAKVQSSEIYPKSAYANNALQIKMQNAAKEEYLYIGVKWFRNGQEIYNYNEPKLVPGKFAKGDQIRAEVNLLGPEALDEPVVTLPVTILNTPPQIVEASSDLKSEASDVIFARVNAVDADRDQLRYRYKWYINGSEVKGETKATLNVAKCEKGDEVYAEIVATDGLDESQPFKAEAITIGSNAPEITSTPPQVIGKDRKYVYQVAANAPDPSSLTYALDAAPEGMTIDQTGRIEWQLPNPEVGERVFQVVIRVTDSTGGEAVQQFELAVTATAATTE